MSGNFKEDTERLSGNLPGGNRAQYSFQLLEKARADTQTVLREVESRLDGLSQAEANSRLKQYGLNEIAREKRQSALMRLLSNVKNPLVLLLTALGVLSCFLSWSKSCSTVWPCTTQYVVVKHNSYPKRPGFTES